MNRNIINAILLGFFASQKQDQNPDEAGFTQAFNQMLQNPAMTPFLEDLHAQGMVDQKGNLTKYGQITVKKLNGNTRNPKQLNFERLTQNSTPGYNAALGLTALNKAIEQFENGIFRKITPELAESFNQLSERMNHFFQNVEIDSPPVEQHVA